MINLQEKEIWFVTGSQHLYGDKVLKKAAANAKIISCSFDEDVLIPVQVIYKPVVTTAAEIFEICSLANNSKNCLGLIVWMHTFSPAKMWINGLKILSKPLLHLHTQFNSKIPWDTIDMDFMNLNQSAHGDREFGFLTSRMRKSRKVVVGHWQQKDVRSQIAIWSRVAAGWSEMQTMKIARIGDNMREVAVTEGDKVEAQIRFGFSVNGYGLEDVTKHLDSVDENAVNTLLESYQTQYHIEDEVLKSDSLRDAAVIELTLRTFLNEGGFKAFTDTFENLGSFKQLPGIAVQRLMADGYGFGAEGDWKTAALLRTMKVMCAGLDGGTSFMEDYTYDFHDEGSKVLGAHMLEICPSITAEKPRCEIHPLFIGGKEDPARLVFDAKAGPAINVSLIDIGGRFRLLLNEVDCVVPENDLPMLPVARALWTPKPNLEIAAQSWIIAGGAHHTVFSQSITTEFIEDFAEMAGIELIIIDADTKIRDLKDKIRWNEAYYHSNQNMH
jgi:L-arabinose isomerase